MKRKELLVAAIENGTVIDHIPSDKLFDVVSLLHLERMKTAVTVGFNLKSKITDQGHKSIIKIADKFFTDEELNQLSVVAPNVTLCLIRDYEVVEKRQVEMPDMLEGIVRCPNAKCITNNEPMRTRFRVTNRELGTLQCCYCNKDLPLSEVKIVEQQ